MPRTSRRRTLLTAALVLAATCLVAGLFIDRRVTAAQFRVASDRLELLMTLRRGALESYFDTVRAELTFWSINPELRSQLRQLRLAWSEYPGPRMERLQAGFSSPQESVGAIPRTPSDL